MSEINSDPIVQLDIKLDKLCNGIEVMKDKQDLMAEDISKIKEVVYNPDEGLYARLRALESWQSSSSKMIWILFTAVVSLIAGVILKYVS